MLNSVSISQPSSSAITADRLPATPWTPSTQSTLLRAFRTDNWDLFNTLRNAADAGINVQTDLNDDGQNYLHQAIQSGGEAIALNLVALSDELGTDFLDHTDRFGHSPLVHAARSKEDRPELVDALINAGARRGLSSALQAAAERGHTQTAERLMRCPYTNAPQALARVLKQNPGESGMNAAQFLISRGVNVTDALADAINMGWANLADKGWQNVADTLVLRFGAQASIVLVQTIEQLNPTSANYVSDLYKLELLLRAGADVVSTLIDQAKSSQSDKSSLTIETLLVSEKMMLLANWHWGPRSDITALTRLIQSGDTQAAHVLSQHILPDTLHCDHLTQGGNPDVIEALIDVQLLKPEPMLASVARAGKLGLLKALIQAGVPTANLLKNLLGPQQVGMPPDTVNILMLLAAAGADRSLLPREFTDYVDSRKAEAASISALSLDKQNDALQFYAQQGQVEAVAMLLDQGVNKIHALTSLNQAQHYSGMRTVLAADRLQPDVLVDLVKAGATDVARTFITEELLSTAALMDLLVRGGPETARVLIPALTTGSEVLALAARSNNEALTQTLIDLGADGPGALILLLETRAYEVARQFATRFAEKVNIHDALRQAYRNDSDNAKEMLVTMGADLVTAALRGLTQHDDEATTMIIQQNGPAVAKPALLHVVNNDSLPNDLKSSYVKFLIDQKIDTDGALTALAERHDIPKLRMLIMAGAPTHGLLMDLGKQGDRITAQALITAGADFITAIRILRDNGEHDAATLLTFAVTVARDRRINPEGPRT